MRVSVLIVAAAFIGGLSGTAMAQTTYPPTTTTQSQSPVPNANESTTSGWTAAVFMGSNFGNDLDQSSLNFGGEVGYLWHGIIGGEFLVDVAPDFQINDINDAFLADDPSLNSYMFNAIAAVPLGFEGWVEPYISGGFGSVQMKTSVFDSFTPVVNPLVTPQLLDDLNAATDGSRSAFGSNIGGGFMGFADKVGFRGDIRYYRASTGNDLTDAIAADIFTDRLISGLDFWRATAGLAFRW